MYKNIDIQQRVEQHYDFVCSEYPKEQILGVFLYGSQNYNLDAFNSDVDTKAIYIPTYEEIVFNKPISTQLVLENGEHCEIKDIREFANNLFKQNINFVEVLFTQYFVLNPKYEKLWNKYFIEPRERIARYDIHKGVVSMSHQAYHTLCQAEKVVGSINPCKKIANTARLVYFLQRYIRGDLYYNCLVPTDEFHEILMDLKFKPKKIECYESTIQILKMILDFYKKTNYEYLNDPDEQAQVASLVKEGILTILQL